MAESAWKYNRAEPGGKKTNARTAPDVETDP